jgi:hypothetical protein
MPWADHGRDLAGMGLGYGAALRATALSAFGVLYAPIPVPAFNLYGKVGLSSLHSAVSATGSLGCFPPILCLVPNQTVALQLNRTDTRLAYGAGLQAKLGRFAIRAEYERISAGTGDPCLMSLGLIWSFD